MDTRKAKAIRKKLCIGTQCFNKNDNLSKNYHLY